MFEYIIVIVCNTLIIVDGSSMTLVIITGTCSNKEIESSVTDSLLKR